jgi:hypothetical protein
MIASSAFAKGGFFNVVSEIRLDAVDIRQNVVYRQEQINKPRAALNVTDFTAQLKKTTEAPRGSEACAGAS